MKVLVLGCGPAGLMAAHAATQAGAEVRIVSNRVPSQIGGAQYLHTAIPGVTTRLPETKLTYRKFGTQQGYALKVYGNVDAPTSWEHFEGEQEAWSLQAAYDKLRRLYWSRVDDHKVEPADVSYMTSEHDLVLCTLPAPVLCFNSFHSFYHATVHIAETPLVSVRDEIWYSGIPAHQWYRASNIFGHQHVEIGSRSFDPATYHGWMGLVRKGIKPLRTDCNCHMRHENFIRLGRFGKWEKGVLTSDAYAQAIHELSNRQEQGVN